MKILDKGWNAATICGIFVLLIFITATAPKLWTIIKPMFEGKQKYAGKQCKPIEQGVGGIRVSRSRAELIAIAKWSKEASKYGPLYNLWHNAEAKKMRCRKMRGSPVFNCAAKAKPCKNIDPMARRRHAHNFTRPVQ